MSQTPTTEETQDELSWEAAVARFLEDHPEFFDQYPDVLARLRLHHETEGGTVSLIERQLQVLRTRESSLDRQLRELVSNARDNDVIGNRLHRFALAMVEAGTADEVLDSANELLRQEFKLDGVSVRRYATPAFAGTRPEWITAGDPVLAELLRQFTGGKPLCGSKLDEARLAFLFADQAGAIRSTALLPLGDKRPRGVLALGSADAQRFHAGMGTVYLTRLGDLLDRTLERLAV